LPKNRLTILHCVSEYPTDYSDMNLSAISELRARYNTKVGLSDHSRSVYDVALAPLFGGSMIEFHFTHDRSQVGPDHKVSWLPNEVHKLVKAIRRNLLIAGDGKKKLGINSDSMRDTFGNSICANRNLLAGETLTMEDICLMKPRTGIPASEINSVLGKKLISNIKCRRPIMPSMFSK